MTGTQTATFDIHCDMGENMGHGSWVIAQHGLPLETRPGTAEGPVLGAGPDLLFHLVGGFEPPTSGYEPESESMNRAICERCSSATPES